MREAREHTGSWYAASRKSTTLYPRLEGSQRCDVAIVGAGFTGVSAALTLAERGVDVAVVEANRVGWGASGRNGGQLIDGFTDVDRIGKRLGAGAADIVYRMGLECRDLVVERIRRYAIDCDLRYGFIDVALRHREMRKFEGELADKLRRGYPHTVSLVPQERIRDYVGSDRYVGGMTNDGNGHLHPLDLCIGEARAAVDLGATIFEQSPAIRIRHGRRPAVETADGELRSSSVLLAGNAYLDDTEPRLRGRIIPVGSYIIATQPLGRQLAGELLPRNSACCDQRTALDYFRLTPDDRLLFGGLCNYSGRVPRNIAATLRPKMLKVFPMLADAGIEYQWGGNIAISLNRIPQFGRIEGNTWYVQGYSGHGLAPAHLAGKLLADAVCGDLERFDIFARVRHFKVPGGRWFANPMLALGMLYYRLRELL